MQTAARTAGLALFLLTCLNLFNFIDRYILPGVQPLVQKEFGVSDERMGALTYAFFITYMIAAPLTGWLGDRFPRKPLIVAGGFFLGFFKLLAGRGGSVERVYFFPSVVGVGGGGVFVFFPALLGALYPRF